ncbi:hypothetical protein Hdeb2414_s0004g00141611 [Helianthus debilis subsp. tardiflorus]
MSSSRGPAKFWSSPGKVLILSMSVPLKSFMFSACHACPLLRPPDLHILPPLPLWLVQVVHN